MYALYFTDKVNCTPLTPALHLSDLRSSVPGYTEAVARTLKAIMLTLDKLHALYLDLGVASASAPASGARDAELAAGVPYMLRGR